MNIQDIINNVSNFFINLYQNHFALIIIIVVVLVALIVLFSLLMVKRKKREKEDLQNANKQAIAQLTTEEIENISKNVSNPGEFREMVETETNLIETAKNNENDKPEIKEVAATEDKTDKTEKTVTPKKTTTKKQQEQPINEAPAKRVYSGKWKIKKDKNGYFAKLHASNGGLLLQTEHYTTMSGVKSGIETIKKNVENGNFAISIDKNNHYHFKLFSKSNKLICISEDYSSKAKCDNGIASVKRFANTTAIILEENDD